VQVAAFILSHFDAAAQVAQTLGTQQQSQRTGTAGASLSLTSALDCLPLPIAPALMNAVDAMGWTPLMYACHRARKHLVAMFLSMGALATDEDENSYQQREAQWHKEIATAVTAATAAGAIPRALSPRHGSLVSDDRGAASPATLVSQRTYAASTEFGQLNSHSAAATPAPTEPTPPPMGSASSSVTGYSNANSHASRAALSMAGPAALAYAAAMMAEDARSFTPQTNFSLTPLDSRMYSVSAGVSPALPPSASANPSPVCVPSVVSSLTSGLAGSIGLAPSLAGFYTQLYVPFRPIFKFRQGGARPLHAACLSDGCALFVDTHDLCMQVRDGTMHVLKAGLKDTSFDVNPLSSSAVSSHVNRSHHGQESSSDSVAIKLRGEGHAIGGGDSVDAGVKIAQSPQGHVPAATTSADADERGGSPEPGTGDGSAQGKASSVSLSSASAISWGGASMQRFWVRDGATDEIRVAMAELLIEHGATKDMNFLVVFGAASTDAWLGARYLRHTPLSLASTGAFPKVISYLLSKGALVNNASESGGLSPIQLAIRYAPAAVVRTLLKQGANPFLSVRPIGAAHAKPFLPIHAAAARSDGDAMLVS
jgi:ankyrin repeat protein